jgi:hypothetical protein
MANGKSLEMHNTTVFSIAEASALNFRTLVAHVLVSMLGKIFSTILFPWKSPSETSFKSDFVSLKSGAALPMEGNSPEVCAVFSL